MTYTVEGPTNISLNTGGAPYVTPAAPLALVLDFADNSAYPPLPWVAPRLFVAYGAAFSEADGANKEAAAPITRADQADGRAGVHWGAAAEQDLSTGLQYGASEQQDRTTIGLWSGAIPVHSSHASPWALSGNVDAGKGASWGRSSPADRDDYRVRWIMGTPARDSAKAFSWYSVNLAGTIYEESGFAADYLNRDTATTVSLNADPKPYVINSNPLAVDLSITTIQPEVLVRPSVPHDVTYRVTARQAEPRDRGQRLPWGAGQSVWHDYNLPYPVEPNDPDPPDPGELPEIRAVYNIMNTLQITDVATGTPLDIQGVSIGLDLDSMSWKFSGTLYGQGSLALVAPGAGGMKDINVTINTHAWVFSIESYTSDERFPSEKFSIAGVSRTQYMAAPFAPTRSHTNASATTAAQAAAAELQNTGFSLTWPTGNDEDLPDWLIPAGALSYRDKSPAQVVAQIVTAAGGVMVPSMAADSWTIQPRYKAMPWDWDSVTPDAVIYIGMVRSRSAQYEPAPAFNACYVSGVSQGQAVDVHRAGSGGTDPTPDIYEDLITSSEPAISRGKSELAQSGNKVIETLSLFIPENGAAPGVVIPGMIVKVMHDDPGLDYWALALAISISVQRAGGAEIFQSVTLERSA